MDSHTFRTRYRELLARLDEIVSSLRRDVESCHRVQPASPDFAARAHLAAEVVEQLRAHVSEGGRALDLSLPEWEDREALESFVVALLHAMREKEEVEIRRALLAGLAEELRGRRVQHRVPRRKQDLDRLREEAAEDLDRAARSGAQWALPGPKAASAWLEWVGTLSGGELQQRLDEIAPAYPALARLLEEVEPNRLVEQEREGTEGPLQSLCPPGVSEVPSAPQEGPLMPEVPPAGAPLPAEPLSLPIENLADGAEGSMGGGGEDEGPEPADDASDMSEPAAAMEPGQAGEDGTAAAPALSARSQPSPAEPPIAHAARLTEELADFERFQRSHWIDPNGRCAPVPWEKPEEKSEFIDLLRALSREDIRQRAPLGRVWLFSLAMEKMGDVPEMDPGDLRAAADILAAPDSASAGADARRADDIKTALQGDWASVVARAPAWRLRLVLEAMRPTPSIIFSPSALEPFLHEIHFSTPALKDLVRELLQPALRCGRGLQQVVDLLRKDPPRSKDQREQDLRDQRVKLRETYRKLYSAAGGRIERTFARDAWDRYIASIESTMRDLFLPSAGGRGGKEKWDPDKMGERLSALLSECLRCADEANVRFQDRQRMIRGAKTLYDKAVRVNQLMAELLAHGSASPAGLDRASEAAQHLLDSPVPEQPEEMLGRWLVEVSLRGKPERGFRTEAEGAIFPTMDPQVLRQRPRLRELWRSISEGENENDPGRVLAAAALAALPAGEAPLLRPEQVVLRIQEQRAELARLRQESSELAAQELAAQIQKVEEWVAKQEVPAAGGATNTTLVEAWIEEVLRSARDQVAEIVEELGKRARAHQARAFIEKNLSARRFADAMYALSFGHPGADAPRQRATAFRAQAEGLYPRPQETLRRHLEEERQRQHAAGRRRDSLLAELLDTWLSIPESRDPRSYLKLRRCFSQYFLSAKHEGRAFHEQGGPHTINQPLGLPTEALIEWLVRERSPSFVPQMRSFGSLVIATPELAPAGQLGDLASESGTPLVLVLYPGISARRRQEHLERLLREHRCVAILDDLDLCRLLNPGGVEPDRVLGLVELGLEQQHLRALTPFKSQGRAHLPEMFVGRQKETRALAEEGHYTRIFSGRKFGKTALLQHLRQRHDGRELPSGYRLRIVYCDMTGRETEQQVVHEIRTALRERFKDLHLPAPVPSAGEDFEDMMKALLGQLPEQSLLLLLDEADSFVARELRESAARHEQTLSWRMRRLMQSGPVDGKAFPRVRVLFSGYRVTNTRHGAWGNWGDVLSLKPLRVQEAADLIAGPLARLGIDASDQAFAIAHRCGCQPAVLLRFGEVLLDRITSQKDALSPRAPAVRPVDVTATFEDRRVQETIQRVVWDNFEYNDWAAVVFGALLRLFSRQSPGSGLSEAEDRLREELDQLGVPLPPEEDETRGFLREQLKVLAERELLVRERDRYYLRFPHHLDTLRQGLEQEMRQRLDEVRKRPGRGGPEAETAAFLSPERLRVLRKAMDPKAEIRPRALLFVSHWPEALSDPRHGVGAQMDLPPDSVVKAREHLEHLDLRVVRSRECLVVTDICAAGPASAEQLLRERPEELPPPLLTGGIDLLRWAMEADRRSPWFFELTCIGRVDDATVLRWFRNARGLEFPPGGGAEIRRITSNIPLLLRELYLLLREEHGDERTTLTQEHLSQALATLEKKMPEAARQLAGGPPALRLTRREIEVLRMICFIGDEKDPDDLRYALTDGWSTLSEGSPEHAIAAIDETTWDDRLALAVVGRLGLVPMAGPTHDPWLGLRAVGEKDALHRLVRWLPNTGAAPSS